MDKRKIIIPVLIVSAIIPFVVMVGIDHQQYDNRIMTTIHGFQSGLSLEELATNADYIVEGTLEKAEYKEIKIGESDDPKRISAVTYWTMEPDIIYKGDHVKKIIFMTPGGETDKVVATFDVLNWTVGDKVFVYLTKGEDGTLKWYGGDENTFKITEKDIAESYALWKSKPVEQLREEQRALVEEG